MRKLSRAAGLAAALVLAFGLGGAALSGAALADDTAKAPSTGSTKPMGGGPAEQKSLPSSAPGASRTQTTGSTDQSKAVKSMNSDEKAKVEATGK